MITALGRRQRGCGGEVVVEPATVGDAGQAVAPRHRARARRRVRRRVLASGGAEHEQRGDGDRHRPNGCRDGVGVTGVTAAGVAAMRIRSAMAASYTIGGGGNRCAGRR